MTVNETQQRAIAFLARSCRPQGSRPWDEVGILSNLAKVADRPLGDVVLAVIRAASDPNVNTPGVIPTAGPHWAEGSYKPPVPVADRVARQDLCSVCLRPLADHPTTDHQPRRNVRSPEPAVDVTAKVIDLRDLVHEAAANTHRELQENP